MVVQEEDAAPMEVSLMDKVSNSTTKKYVIVKNHVRELEVTTKTEDKGTSKTSLPVGSEKKVIKTKKNNQEKDGSISSSSSVSISEISNENLSEISRSDLDALKTVYRKCKDVMNRIETKYGHLLNLSEDEDGSKWTKRKRKLDQSSEESPEGCSCKLNRKIVYDDEGNEKVLKEKIEDHKCSHKIRGTPKKSSVQIQYEDNEIMLPDNLSSLTKMLQRSDLTTSFRNRVIQKIRLLREEYLNEIRFNRQSLVDQIKANPEDVLDFKGTNLSALVGYPTKSKNK